MAAKDREYDEEPVKAKGKEAKAGEPELSPEGVPYQSSGMPEDRDSVPPGPPGPDEERTEPTP